MRKIKLNFIAIAIIMLIGACSNEALFDENENASPEINAEAGRTLSLTAIMPSEKDVNANTPNTRVGLERNNDIISLTWQAGDKLEFAIDKSGTKTMLEPYVLKEADITNSGKNAKFGITLPSGVEGEFTLYGLYGGRGLSVDDNMIHALLPENVVSNGSIESIESRKDVMLSFVSDPIQADSPAASVTFKHLGSLFSVTLVNSSDEDLSGVTSLQLEGVGGDGQWAYNNGAGGGSINLETGAQTGTFGNFISFNLDNNTLPSGETTFWSWYPPKTGQAWPELKLVMQHAGGSAESVSNKDARSDATVPGMAYYFFAEWDGTTLDFEGGEDLYRVHTMGSLDGMFTTAEKTNMTKMILRGNLNAADFHVMKMQMPNLTELDLKYVTCENDEMPDYAFGKRGDTEPAHPNLTTIVFPENLKKMGTGVCWGMPKLAGVLSFPLGMTEIPLQGFRQCPNLTGLNLHEGIVTINAQAFGFTGGGSFTGPLIIPNSVKLIKNEAFASATFDEVILGNSVETIEYSAFSNMVNNNKQVVFPITLKTLGDKAFFTGQSTAKERTYKFPHTDPNAINGGVPAKEVFRRYSKIYVPTTAVDAFQASGWGEGNVYTILGYDPI